MNEQWMMTTVHSMMRLPRTDYVLVDLSNVTNLTVTIPGDAVVFGDEPPPVRRTYIEGDGIPKLYIDHAGKARGKGYNLWVGYSEATNTLFYRVERDARRYE